MAKRRKKRARKRRLNVARSRGSRQSRQNQWRRWRRGGIHEPRFAFAGVNPGLKGFWRAPRYVGRAHIARVPRTPVVPYQAPATVIVRRNVAPRQPAVPQTKQLVQQQYTRVKFFNQEMLGFELDGAVVTNVVPGGPADDGGVEEGFYAFALNDVQQKQGTLMNAIQVASRPYVIDFGFLPAGWQARWSEQQQRFYFAEHATRQTSWNLPPIEMSTTAVADVESEQTGRGDEGVFTVKVNVEFFDTQQAPVFWDDKAPGTLGVRLSKNTTVEAFIELVENVQDGAMAHLDYEIDYTSAYSKNGKLDYNAVVSRVVSNGEQVEVCGHKQMKPGAGTAASGCCTIL